MNREDFLESALHTLNSVPGASLETIAKAAGVSRATLHRHIDSRSALLTELGGRSLDSWELALDRSGVEDPETQRDPHAFREALTSLISSYVADADSYGFALSEHYLEHVVDLAQRADALIAREHAVWVAAQRAGVLRDDLTPPWIGWILFGLLVGARDGLRAGDLARRSAAEVVTSTFFGGCGR